MMNDDDEVAFASKARDGVGKRTETEKKEKGEKEGNPTKEQTRGRKEGDEFDDVQKQC